MDALTPEINSNFQNPNSKFFSDSHTKTNPEIEKSFTLDLMSPVILDLIEDPIVLGKATHNEVPGQDCLPAGRPGMTRENLPMNLPSTLSQGDMDGSFPQPNDMI